MVIDLVKYIRTDIKGDEVDHDMIFQKIFQSFKSILPSDNSSEIKLEFNASNAFFLLKM